MNKKYKIAILPGDGIGPEVIEAGMIVLDKIGVNADYIYGDIGWEFWCKEGNALPQRTIEMLKKTDCCLFGAITSKPKEEAEKELKEEFKGKGYSYYSPIVKLRQLFDLYINMRPCKAYKGNILNYRDDIDITVFRENTEDLYSGVEFSPLPEELRNTIKKFNKKMEDFDFAKNEEIAVTLRIVTKQRCKRIIRAAFDYAKKTNRKKVTIVEKPNVLRETSGLVVKVAREVAKEYNGIELEETNIDSMCMWLLKNPHNYSVLCTTNMFGDIISDLCGQLVGGLGFASAGNIGDNYAIFEPVHGSAPKYKGMYKINPIATILAIKLMMEYLGENEKANIIENAVSKVIEEGKVRTYDLGGNASTLDMAKAIANYI